MQKVRAKKALGQHFLRNQDIAERIADTLVKHKLPILEVGPGMGVLTQYLIPKYQETKVVEIDTESISYLRVAFPSLIPNIIEADFLSLPLDRVFNGQPFVLIGNYPYNISSQIFFHMLEYRELIPAASGMLQKEVAQRLASGPGSKDYGILSVLLQAWYDIEYLFSVAPGNFDPPPKVQSGVIRMVRNNRKELGCDEQLFKNVVKTTFNRRRKMLRNSLQPLLGERHLPEGYPLLQKRPEQLGVDDFIALTNDIAEVLR
ncbi:16S rRNA (adenine(1518)-N(6)/adenine(1519)-N(6))-dimethyltransferase RsmA [Porphyromonas levii]|uniref:Ribosomal RNA small subunit methyltransferase A n=1 Tax=Porphyromonas levii TaxID=28114 RepID=A0A4Y8WRK6_9PORP|nr:16S rRNA (adenine(1518)-N(6)/adenine(1519)-N(6))-dimethyltransferase RsmA [Porphyromonas levii]MBR8702367.1 Ribosomal RNA small subunit methyltransferase A [Porphyromonas levii]MBR8713057.1 Ribosomal RNA small subunit methyltransferase A [Porphyromonas levii]MBR8715139.1 Ribosomal RNA small subunit methyltransferase A [Porphyromonas levii]MBR8727588.1 Ribosomal RNA small subunit methyltransferase A [Porphyromonas levii]MBR8729020.1 Ribosomal RNA small subunit methyltransferase A [Porphyromo